MCYGVCLVRNSVIVREMIPLTNSDWFKSYVCQKQVFAGRNPTLVVIVLHRCPVVHTHQMADSNAEMTDTIQLQLNTADGD